MNFLNSFLESILKLFKIILIHFYCNEINAVCVDLGEVFKRYYILHLLFLEIYYNITEINLLIWISIEFFQ